MSETYFAVVYDFEHERLLVLKELEGIFRPQWDEKGEELNLFDTKGEKKLQIKVPSL